MPPWVESLRHWLSPHWGDGVPTWMGVVLAAVFGVQSWRSSRQSKSARDAAQVAEAQAEQATTAPDLNSFTAVPVEDYFAHDPRSGPNSRTLNFSTPYNVNCGMDARNPDLLGGLATGIRCYGEIPGTGGTESLTCPTGHLDGAGPGGSYRLMTQNGNCSPFIPGGKQLGVGQKVTFRNVTCAVGADQLIACLDTTSGEHGFIETLWQRGVPPPSPDRRPSVVQLPPVHQLDPRDPQRTHQLRPRALRQPSRPLALPGQVGAGQRPWLVTARRPEHPARDVLAVGAHRFTDGVAQPRPRRSGEPPERKYGPQVDPKVTFWLRSSACLPKD